MKKVIYGLSQKEIEKEVVEAGLPKFRAKQIAEWVYKKNATGWDEIKNVSAQDRDKLSEKLSLTNLRFVEGDLSRARESTKVLFKTHDDHLLESVLISQRGRHTVCVSNQLGCKVGCPFCASGKGKFARHLSAGEIVEQVAWIQQKKGRPVSNIVFMGMGEPFDNYENTVKAVEILLEDWGFAMGARRITVSTSGVTPKIVDFVKRFGGRVRLSISLHSSIPEVRDTLVPINKRYTLEELVSTLEKVHRDLKREITFEYTLIKDVNDSDEEARGVAGISKLLNAKVNIIPYNPIREMDYETPSNNRIHRFKEILEKNHVRVMLRQTAGRDIDAACGQLRLDRMTTK